MNTQQAPSPVQSARLLPAIVASVKNKLNTGGMTNQRKTSTSRVSRVLERELKRLRRSQSTARAGPPRGPSMRSSPGDAAAGAFSAVIAGSTSHQGDAPVVPIHER